MNKQKPKVFISHSWEDNDISRKLAEYFRRDGAEVWIDYARIEGGDSLPKVISNAIDWCDTMILVWSKSAVDSYWVEEEWTCAHSLRKRIVPCLIDRSKLPSILMSRLHIDIKDFEKGYSNLGRALKLIVKEQKVISTQKKIEPKPEIIKSKPKIFRSNAQELSIDDAKRMVKKYDFFDKYFNKNGKGFNHQYKQKMINGEKVVIDSASGLMWQQSGSSKIMNFEDAKKWIKELNQNGFAGLKDWRLPTLEEAMSLMEQEKKNDRYIDPIFDSKQSWIWTADKFKGESRAWVVNFDRGHCFNLSFYNYYSMRAVRSGQSS